MPLNPSILQKIDNFQLLKKKIKAEKAKRDAFQIELDAVKAQIQVDVAAADALEASIIADIKALP